ncbi:MAG: methyltransferase domain-containing protein, partial [Flavobacteriaceae bacterium]|nr:methyltransferase domain-containing protein [Flavobacteriaceae bacterium]
MKHFTKILIAVIMPMLSYAQYATYDWEERDTWMDTAAIFKTAGIEKGDFVADIGCHEGYLSIRLANAVGNDGRVYAVDVRDDRLATLSDNIKERQLENINVILGDYDDPKLPTETLDVVFIMDTYHEITDYMRVLNHVKKALKPGGKVVIIEKLKSRIKGKSREAQTDAHSLSIPYVKDELESIG